MSKGKIEFDKSKILTAVTADQAKAGDWGWVGDNIVRLRTRVNESEPVELALVRDESFYSRFALQNRCCAILCTGIRVGKSYISYKELVEDYIFVDTGKPAGVKV